MVSPYMMGASPVKPSSDKIAIDRQLVPDTRIEVIDILRGFALLGILIMNIQSFSMVNIAYVNPTVGGTLNGVNFWVYVLTHTLADQKFMTIFSLLFGVSSALIYQKLSAQQRPARVYLVRRNLWLLLIGLLHGCFVWHGDILVSYALSGFILLMLLRLSALIQLSIGLVLLCMPVLINGLAVQSIPYMNEFFGLQVRPNSLMKPRICAVLGGSKCGIAYPMPLSLILLATCGVLVGELWV